MLGHCFILLLCSHSDTSSPSTSKTWRMVACFICGLLNHYPLLERTKRTEQSICRIVFSQLSTESLSVVLKKGCTSWCWCWCWLWSWVMTPDLWGKLRSSLKAAVSQKTPAKCYNVCTWRFHFSTFNSGINEQYLSACCKCCVMFGIL